MASVVLVHGAWHWGGCWAPVQDILEDAGYTVYAPSLALHRGSSLNVHIEQVVDLIREHNLSDVVLVGHSYGGAVVSGVLARVASRIHHTVFLDALLPEFGCSLIELLLPPIGAAAVSALCRLQAMLPPFATAGGFGIHDARDAAWIDSHLRPHPSATLVEPFPYPTHFDPARCTYVACTEPMRFSSEPTLLNTLMIRLMPGAPLTRFSRRAADAGWSVVELAVGHDVMVIAPEAVATIIAEVAPLADELPLRERAVGA